MLNLINPEHPYLGHNSSKEYVASVQDMLISLDEFLTPTEFRNLHKKLQVSKSNINEAQYLQAVCELTVCLYFAKNYQSTFIYEDKVNPPKDVDCSFRNDQTKYNIEVKCADFTVVEKVKNQDSFKVSALGRMDEYPDLITTLKDVFESSEQKLTPYKHLDNRMKDYLIGAHDKFSDENYENIVNVLWVCCDDVMDMTNWTSYLTGIKGLLTKASFHDTSTFNKVDMVVLSNLHHRHAKYQDKTNISNHWDMSSSFNIMFCNPGRKSNKENAIKNFYNIVPNFSKEVSNYSISGELDALKLSMYVNQELRSKGLHFFNG